MAAEKLYDSLDKAKKALETAIDAFDELSRNASMFGGDIARVLTSQAQVNIDAIVNIIEGTNQNSIESLYEYIDAVPLKATRSRRGDEPYRMPAPAPQQNIDVTPNTSAGPLSSVAKQEEDIDLSEYYKKNFKNKSRMKESEFEPSWDSIRSNDLFVNSCDLGDTFDQSAYDDYIPGVDDGFVSVSPRQERQLINDYSDMPDMEIGEGSWEQAVASTNADMKLDRQFDKDFEEDAYEDDFDEDFDSKFEEKLIQKNFKPNWRSIKDEVSSKIQENEENDYSDMPEMLENNGSWEQALKANNGSFNLLKEMQNYSGEISTGLNIQDGF